MTFISEMRINLAIASAQPPSSERLERLLSKAEEKKGLEMEEAAELLAITSPADAEMLFRSAWKVKNEIYGNRLVFFAPLYLSSHCINDCEYCGFHKRNRSMPRRRLTLPEVRRQAKLLIGMGHRRLLIEVGEHPVMNSANYVCDCIREIYSVRTPKGNIRRVNVNVAATSVSNYRKLREAGIGTYQLFQETYHRQTYEALHRGPKRNYMRQLLAMDRAFKAGIDDVGLGALFGLYDYRFEALALLAHAEHLQGKFGVGPHTISVPRFRPAPTVTFTPQHAVSDFDFLKLIAVLRLSVPYTGMILSTRESPEIREKAFKIGISQASAASCTTPGGYGPKKGTRTGMPSASGTRVRVSGVPACGAQFSVSDERSVDEVLKGVVAQGLIPSFCTACYRRGRTGGAFMELAKPGEIQHMCRPNAILTFKEYLVCHASPSLRKKGERLIEDELWKIEDPSRRKETKRRLGKIENGERDLFF